MNCIEWVEAAFALYKLRAVPVNVNFRYVEEEMRYLFDNSDLVALVYQREYGPIVIAARDAQPKLQHFFRIEWDGSEADDSKLEPIEFAADLDLKVTSNNKVFRAPPARDTSLGRFLWLMCSRRSGLLSARWLFRDTLVGLLPHAAATRSRTTSLRIL